MRLQSVPIAWSTCSSLTLLVLIEERTEAQLQAVLEERRGLVLEPSAALAVCCVAVY